MKNLRAYSLALTALVIAIYLPACKTKKVVTKTTTTQVVTPTAPVEQKQPESPVVTVNKEVATTVEKPDYNFTNLQFEFNSAILKTSSYPMLDKVAREIKKDASVKFILKGYSSAEGTPEHNMTLSEERANAVKTYLINAGVDQGQLTTKGYGESNPIASNSTEEGKVVNRRVEIKKR